MSRIAIGDQLPSVKVVIHGKERNLQEYLADKKFLLVGVPGAFTPECTSRHIPEIVKSLEELRKGIDLVAILSVNDPYVLRAWATELGVKETDIAMIADWEAQITNKLGMQLDARESNLGSRCQRFALLAENSEVKWVGMNEDAYTATILKEGKDLNFF